jgi:hypothetical protein
MVCLFCFDSSGCLFYGVQFSGKARLLIPYWVFNRSWLILWGWCGILGVGGKVKSLKIGSPQDNEIVLSDLTG